MGRLSHFVQGVASGERARARLRRTGRTPKGDPLWTDEEKQLLRKHFPDYRAAMKALGGLRSYAAVRHQAQKMGLAPTRNLWTAAAVSRLRRIYSRSSPADLSAAFPDRSATQLREAARYYGFARPRKLYVSTGIPIIDQIRDRCFALGLSMTDLDEMAGTKRYFAKAGWHASGLNAGAVAKAVRALDGQLSATWNDDPLPARNVVRFPAPAAPSLLRERMAA